MNYCIRLGRRTEIDHLRQIERDAGQAFIAAGYPDVAAYDPVHRDDLRDAIADGMLFVAVDVADRPVGFLLCDEVDHDLYISELNVHPDHAGNRLAVPLLAAAEQLAHELILSGLILTTFRSVPWNAPYYARLGFLPMGEDEIGPDLLIVIARQKTAGLNVADRVAMRRAL